MTKSGVVCSRITLQIGDRSAPPLLLPPEAEDLYASMGRLIVRWAIMEQHLNEIIDALVSHNSANEPKWRRFGFSKRRNLLKEQWAIFAHGSPKLAGFLEPADQRIGRCKHLRDQLAHEQMVFGADIEGPSFVQFPNERKGRNKPKSYSAKDFNTAAHEANQAAGFFLWVMSQDSAWQLPSHDISRLHSLQSAGRRTPPTE